MCMLGMEGSFDKNLRLPTQAGRGKMQAMERCSVTLIAVKKWKEKMQGDEGDSKGVQQDRAALNQSYK
jgi:hypothetical protein